MIFVDQKKSVGCGLCARICHEQCITLASQDGKKVEHIDHSICNTCTQCIAVCPQRALSWNHSPLERANWKMLPSAEQLGELLKQRRATRHYEDNKIDKQLVEEIVSYAIYAPTNNYSLRAIVVDDPQMIKQSDQIIMSFAALMYNLCYKSILIFNLLSRITTAINAKQRFKMKRAQGLGRSCDSLITIIVFIVGDRRILLSEASAQYALYNAIFYAQSNGLGSRIKAAGTLTLDSSRTARKLPGLEKRQQVLGTLELGYPSFRISNKVAGKTMDIQWYRREQDG